jgi:NAD(P)-dependent dehydrogenase (short-subunit alcohol dehydrogenase family)
VALGQAKVFAAEAGMKVMIADIRQDHLDAALAYFRGKHAAVHGIRLDINDRDACRYAAEETERRFGSVQLLCNTAGVSQFGPVENATFADWDWQIDVNLKGMINVVQIFLPRMIERRQGGHIVNTASMSAFVALPNTAIYCTTKYAVRGLSESLRLELGKFNIGVSCLCPGAVNTNIHESVLARPDRYGDSGYYGADPETFKRLKSVIEGGFDPVALGRVVRDAVERNDFWILPFPEFIPTMAQRNSEVMAALNQYSDHPDYARRTKLRAAQGRPMPGAN